MLFGLLPHWHVRRPGLRTAPWSMPYPQAETRIWNSGVSLSMARDWLETRSVAIIRITCDLSATPYTTFRARAWARFSATIWSAITTSSITAGTPERRPVGRAGFRTTKSKRLTATTDFITSFPTTLPWANTTIPRTTATAAASSWTWMQHHRRALERRLTEHKCGQQWIFCG